MIISHNSKCIFIICFFFSNCGFRSKMHICRLLSKSCLMAFFGIYMSLCSMRIATPAHLLAAQAGATKLQEYIDDGHKESSPKFQKRLIAVSADCDTRNYQGEVGRAGFDFPVLTKIPNTKFNCQHYGNGYFADLDTKCQVFHICDEGKKISFLCPNGTIFRQLDLICDWWFKVDCLDAPNHYTDSSEMLTLAQRARSQSKLPILQPIKSTEQFSMKTKKKHALLNGSTSPNIEALAFNRRIDTDIEESDEFLDFEDILLKRKNDREKKTISKYARDSSAIETIQFFDSAKPVGYTYTTPENSNHGKLFKNRNRIVDNSMASIRSVKVSQNHAGKQMDSKSYSNSSAKPYLTKTALKTTPIMFVKGEELKTTNIPSVSHGKILHQANTITQKKIGNQFVDSSQLNLNFPVYTPSKNLTTKAKEKLFYTPTIPNLTTKATPENLRIYPSLQTASRATKNAMEMMKTLHELDTKTVLENRSGVKTSPSFGPNALHSLALYFADDLDVNVTATKSPNKIQPQAEHLTVNEERPNYNSTHTTLFSQRTVDKYRQLFNIYAPVTITDSSQITNRLTNDSGNDLEGQYSRHPVFSVSGLPQIRELAQVFTQALSAYLQDPATFRHVLSEIRPKPAQHSMLSNHIDRIEELKKEQISSEESSYFLTFNQITTAPSDALLENSESLDFSDTALPPTVEYATTTDSTTTINSIKDIPQQYEGDVSTEHMETTATEYQHKNLYTHNGVPKNELADEVNKELETLKPPIYKTIDNPESFGATLSSSNYFLPHNDTSSKLTGSTTVSPRWNGEFLKKTTDSSNTIYLKLLPPRHSKLNSSHKEVYLHSEQEKITKDEEQFQRAQSQFINANYGSLEDIHTDKTIYNSFNTNTVQQRIIQNSHMATMTPITVKELNSTKQIRRENTENLTAPVDIASLSVYKKGTVTPNAETTVTYTLSVDPITINDGLMELERYVVRKKPIAYTYLPNNEFKAIPLLSWYSTTPSNIINTVRGKSFSFQNPSKDKSNENELMETLQRKANQIFGDLDKTEVDHLMNVIKTADANKSVRKLILLLIQTCDEDHTKAVEDSRKALLNALISMDRQENKNIIHVVNSKQSRSGKSSIVSATTDTTQVTQHERFVGTTAELENKEQINCDTTTTSYIKIPTDLDLITETPTTLFTESYLNIDSEITVKNVMPGQYVSTSIPTTTSDYESTVTVFTTTEHPSTTIAPTVPKTSRDFFTSTFKNRNAMLRNRVSKRTNNGEHVVVTFRNLSNQHPDSRALELLKSLYSLASQWG